MVTLTLLPKQLRFLRSSAREVLYSGAFGAGKTRALAYKLAMRASVPGAREGLARKVLKSVKATTLRTLLEPEGGMPPVLPPDSYSWHQGNQTIKIHGGGEIVYFGFDDPRNIGSYNLTGAAVDEIVELTTEDYTQLRGRIRLQAPGLINQIYGACNPGPPTHWAAVRFGLAGGSMPADGCEAIQTRSAENWFLPAAYLADLATMTGIRRKRYVDGIWAGAEGLVYDGWDRERCAMAREGPWERVVFGLDDGYTNPCSIGKWGVDSDGRMHRIAEHYAPGLLNRNKVEVLVRMGALEAEAVVVDPAAAELRAELRNAGLPVVAGVNDVWDGIQIVQQRLSLAGDGRPRLTVDPGCSAWLGEVEGYQWRTGRDGATHDEPVKVNDHAMDETRYVAQYLREEPVQVW